MWVETACEALSKGKCLELRYHGMVRVVEVHAVGASSDGQDLMRVWQVLGGSRSGGATGWKLLRLADTRSPLVTQYNSFAPREGYVRGDPALATIYCQL